MFKIMYHFCPTFFSFQQYQPYSEPQPLRICSLHFVPKILQAIITQLQELKTCGRPMEIIKQAWCDMKNYSEARKENPEESLMNIRKEDFTLRAVSTEQWTKFHTQSCYGLAGKCKVSTMP
jgi:hypothetical protein